MIRFPLVLYRVPRSARSFQTVGPSGEIIRDGLPAKRGLYDPSLEKGAFHVNSYGSLPPTWRVFTPAPCPLALCPVVYC